MRFLIVGAGDVGTSLATNLAAHQHDVVLVEKEESRVGADLSALDLQVLRGNGASPEVLIKAGIESADYVIAVTDVDEVNIATCFLSRLINPKPKRIARVRDVKILHESIQPQLLSEYFDLIINPEQAAADYLMQLFRIPGAREIVEFEGGKIRIIGLAIGADSPLLNLKLNAVKKLQQEAPLLVVAVMRGSKLIVPKGEDKIKAGDIIYAVTVPEKTRLLFELAGKTLHENKSAVIWGETYLAESAARSLEALGTSVKLILGDTALAAELASELKSVLVLSGDGANQSLLIEENIADTDVYIAASTDDENNILAALLAKKLGAKTAMALVNKSTYLPIVSAIGVDVVISSRIAAASAIFRHIHSHSIIYESALQHEGAGFIEVDVHADFPFCGKVIKELKLPYGILVTAIVRMEQAIIPSGESSILEGDRVVIFVIKSALRKLEKILGIRLELFT